MAAISLGFGMDIREVFPIFGGGNTRGEAVLAHLKGRGKGPGQFLGVLRRLVKSKILPPYLDFDFDFRDDAEDRQAAEIAKTRSAARAENLGTGVIDVRTAREQMLDFGEITAAQFEALELADGRLASGVPVLSLFASADSDIADLLDLGFDDVANTALHDAGAVMAEIDALMPEVFALMESSRGADIRRARQARAALDELRKLYEGKATADRELAQEIAAAFEPDPAETEAATGDTIEGAGSLPDDASAAPADDPVGDELGDALKAYSRKEIDAARDPDGRLNWSRLVGIEPVIISPDSPDAPRGILRRKATVTMRREFRRLIGRLWDEEITRDEFLELAGQVIGDELTDGYLRGTQQFGVTEDDLTDEDREELGELIKAQVDFLTALAAAIVGNNRTASGGDLVVREQYTARAELWANRYRESFNAGTRSAARDALVEWQYGPTEHCTDCLNYNGKVYRASVWAKAGIRPQMSTLECGGYLCQCKFTPTTKPETPGVPAPPVGRRKEQD
jgi:hypothetical protein